VNANLKRRQLLKERFAEINLENRILSRKMKRSQGEICGSIQWRDSHPTRGTSVPIISLHGTTRKQELKRINAENKIMLQRVSSTCSTYSNKDLARSWKENEKYFNSRKQMSSPVFEPLPLPPSRPSSGRPVSSRPNRPRSSRKVKSLNGKQDETRNPNSGKSMSTGPQPKQEGQEQTHERTIHTNESLEAGMRRVHASKEPEPQPTDTISGNRGVQGKDAAEALTLQTKSVQAEPKPTHDDPSIPGEQHKQVEDGK
jgi:hypothetical protein